MTELSITWPSNCKVGSVFSLVDAKKTLFDKHHPIKLKKLIVEVLDLMSLEILFQCCPDLEELVIIHKVDFIDPTDICKYLLILKQLD